MITIVLALVILNNQLTTAANLYISMDKINIPSYANYTVLKVAKEEQAQKKEEEIVIKKEVMDTKVTTDLKSLSLPNEKYAVIDLPSKLGKIYEDKSKVNYGKTMTYIGRHIYKSNTWQKRSLAKGQAGEGNMLVYIDGHIQRYYVAVGSGIWKTKVEKDISVPNGRYADAILNDGTVIPLIIGEVKADMHTNKPEHIYMSGGYDPWDNKYHKPDYSILEFFFVDYSGNPGVSNVHPEWTKSGVKQLVVYDKFLLN